MIFVDTSFWYAAADRRDQRHDEAVSLLRAHDGRGLVTSDRVLEETWTLTRRRLGHPAAVALSEGVLASERVRRLAIDPQLAESAWRWLRRHDERSYSFVDASSFVLMSERGLREAFAFDGDFTAAGFVELRSP